MKRIFLLLLSGVLLSSVAMAQTNGFTQRGRATQEMKNNGLVIAHPSLPLKSKATVTNTKTEKQVEVTVFARIPPSFIRIADLSPDVWQALEITSDTNVIISTSPPQKSPLDSPPPVAAIATPEPVAAAQSASAPITTAPAPKTPTPAPEAAQPTSAPVAPPLAPAPSAPTPVTAQPAPMPAAKTTTEGGFRPAPQPFITVDIFGAPSPAPVPQTPPAHVPQAPSTGNIQIIPGLPDPNNGKIYHLQVGAFSMPCNAAYSAQRMRSAGFNVVIEPYSGMYRVIAANIPAVLVFSSVQRIAALGIRQIWVKEQGR